MKVRRPTRRVAGTFQVQRWRPPRPAPLRPASRACAPATRSAPRRLRRAQGGRRRRASRALTGSACCWPPGWGREVGEARWGGNWGGRRKVGRGRGGGGRGAGRRKESRGSERGCAAWCSSSRCWLAGRAPHPLGRAEHQPQPGAWGWRRGAAARGRRVSCMAATGAPRIPNHPAPPRAPVGRKQDKRPPPPPPTRRHLLVDRVDLLLWGQRRQRRRGNAQLVQAGELRGQGQGRCGGQRREPALAAATLPRPCTCTTPDKPTPPSLPVPPPSPGPG
jgi:hypothetical protein